MLYVLGFFAFDWLHEAKSDAPHMLVLSAGATWTMLDFHHLQVGNIGLACVAFIRAGDGVKVALARSSCSPGAADCVLAEGNSRLPLPSQFSSQISAESASSIAERLLRADFILHTNFNQDRIVEVDIPPFDPKSVAGSPGSLAEVRKRAHSLGAMIRPSLLAPQGATERLYEYQRIGADWLLGRSAAILADDMGLGKTPQAIVALGLLFAKRPLNSALIVAPKQLMANWERELAVWAPELSWSRLTVPSRWREEAWKSIFNRVHVLITNYEQVASLQQLDSDFRFSTVVLDEAHRVRNADTAVAARLRLIDRDRTWALTGTPLERSATDVWTLLSIVESRRFNISRRPRGNEALKARARPYVLRRLKRDVLPQLPATIGRHELLELLPRQRRKYDSTLKLLQAAPDNETLTMLNDLRAQCDLDTESGQSSKLERITSILKEISAAKEKAVVFSYLLNPLDALADILARNSVKYVQLRGDLSAEERASALQSFSDDPEISAMLISTRVGGEGLNLVEANHVLFINRWWNPSANDQARDRVLRIGQERTVIVYTFTCRNTVEETLDKILEEKVQLTASVVDPLVASATDDLIMREVVNRL